jgi:hypothetical protein
MRDLVTDTRLTAGLLKDVASIKNLRTNSWKGMWNGR